MTTKFFVIFDNGGGTTLQVGKRGYVHNYDDAAQCAEDVKVLLSDGNTAGWEGDEPEGRMDYDADMERNGGYQWHNQGHIKRAIKEGEIESSYGWNMHTFYAALGVRVTGVD